MWLSAGEPDKLHQSHHSVWPEASWHLRSQRPVWERQHDAGPDNAARTRQHGESYKSETSSGTASNIFPLNLWHIYKWILGYRTWQPSALLFIPGKDQRLPVTGGHRGEVRRQTGEDVWWGEDEGWTVCHRPAGIFCLFFFGWAAGFRVCPFPSLEPRLTFLIQIRKFLFIYSHHINLWPHTQGCGRRNPRIWWQLSIKGGRKKSEIWHCKTSSSLLTWYLHLDVMEVRQFTCLSSSILHVLKLLRNWTHDLMSSVAYFGRIAAHCSRCHWNFPVLLLFPHQEGCQVCIMLTTSLQLGADTYNWLRL